VSRRFAVVLVAILLAGGAGALFWWRSRSRPAEPATAITSARPSRNPPTRDPATIPAQLRDSSWQTRLGAAHALRTMTALSVPRRAVLLAEVLDREAVAPAQGPPFTGSYLPLTSMLRLQYITVLSSLGPSATAALQSAPAPSSAAGREWRVLALSATGDRSSVTQLRELLGSADPAVRMTAARYLGLLQDRGAISALQRVLSDPFIGKVVSDHPRNGAGGPGGFHPVREQAARALRVLGLTVERRGDSFVVQ
jgi:HEAT repeat protein